MNAGLPRRSRLFALGALAMAIVAPSPARAQDAAPAGHPGAAHVDHPQPPGDLRFETPFGEAALGISRVRVLSAETTPVIFVPADAQGRPAREVVIPARFIAECSQAAGTQVEGWEVRVEVHRSDLAGFEGWRPLTVQVLSQARLNEPTDYEFRGADRFGRYRLRFYLLPLGKTPLSEASVAASRPVLARVEPEARLKQVAAVELSDFEAERTRLDFPAAQRRYFRLTRRFTVTVRAALGVAVEDLRLDLARRGRRTQNADAFPQALRPFAGVGRDLGLLDLSDDYHPWQAVVDDQQRMPNARREGESLVFPFEAAITFSERAFPVAEHWDYRLSIGAVGDLAPQQVLFVATAWRCERAEDFADQRVEWHTPAAFRSRILPDRFIVDTFPAPRDEQP